MSSGLMSSKSTSEGFTYFPIFTFTLLTKPLIELYTGTLFVMLPDFNDSGLILMSLSCCAYEFIKILWLFISDWASCIALSLLA